MSFFDAMRERVDSTPIWVQLPGLQIVKAIDNSLGQFMEADLCFKQTSCVMVAKVLVGIDLCEGLGGGNCAPKR